MPGTEEEALSRFLDGEIDQETARRIRGDPAQARRAAALADQDRALGDWFGAQLSDPPTALEGAVRAAFARRRARRRAGLRQWLLPVAATVAVAVLGVGAFDYLIERRVGRAIDEMRAERASDLTLLARAMQEVLETRESGNAVAYRNDATGLRVTLVPRRTWQSETGHWCREFVEMFEGAGSDASPVSTACRTADGQWMRVRTELPAALAPVLPVKSTDKSL